MLHETFLIHESRRSSPHLDNVFYREQKRLQVFHAVKLILQYKPWQTDGQDKARPDLVRTLQFVPAVLPAYKHELLEIPADPTPAGMLARLPMAIHNLYLYCLMGQPKTASVAQAEESFGLAGYQRRPLQACDHG